MKVWMAYTCELDDAGEGYDVIYLGIFDTREKAVACWEADDAKRSAWFRDKFPNSVTRKEPEIREFDVE